MAINLINTNKNNNPTHLSLLQRFGLLFFSKRETTIVFWISLLVFGLLSYTTLMQRQGFPNVDVPISIVNGSYFVNNKEVVDSEVTKPATEIIKKINIVKTVASESGDNYFLITIRYKDGTVSAEGNSVVRQALQNANILPSLATIEFKAIDAGRFAEQSDLLLSVSSKQEYTPSELQQRAAAVAIEMQSSEGVKKAVVLKQIATGINLQTGQSQTEQRSFDRLGVHEGSGAIVYTNAVTVGLQAKPSTDALKLYDTVQEKIKTLNQSEAFSDVKITVSADFAESIRSQISNLQTNLLEGLLVVIFVSFLLISFRAGLATALSMATVLLITIAALYASGTSLNTITLFALILSLGLIVDDTTIMVEAIAAANGSGGDKKTIVAGAIKRVARASFAGTITTMLAFAPMLFISGILGSFIRILPISIIIALGVSLLVSLSLVPFFGHFLLVNIAGQKVSRNPVVNLEKWTASKLASLVRSGKSSRARRLLYGGSALLISLVMLASSLPFFSKLKFDIFPSTKDSNELSLVIKYPEATTIAAAQVIADKANIIIGDTLGKNMTRLSYRNSGTISEASANITLLNYSQRQTRSPQLIVELQTAFKDFNGAQIKVEQIDAGPPKDDYPFGVRIFENDTKKAQKFADELMRFLDKKPISRANGQMATIIRLQASRSSVIKRDNLQRYIEVRGGFDASDVSALVTPAEKAVRDTYNSEKLAQFGLSPDQVRFDFGNESNNQDSFKSMLLAFPIILILMYLLLLLQFRSFLQPILIFAAIPFSFFGVAAGLYYTDNPLSFFVLVGFFALIGIAVNNTILLTDYANQARDAGADHYDAAADALQARFRPLITTSLTSVVALIPLALSDPFWQSLSVTLIFGLLSSTLLVVVAFPYIYLLGEWARRIGRKMWRRELWRPLQLIADILLFPIRVVSFIFWVIFSWQK